MVVAGSQQAAAGGFELASDVGRRDQAVVPDLHEAGWQNVQ